MHKSADVVVVGGGIIGMAIAFYLAKEQFGKVIVLEKEQFLGSWSTSKAAGGIRAQFATEVNVRMSMLSEKLFCQFKEDTGSEAVYDQVGYMFLLHRDEDVATFTKHVEMQREVGLNVELLKPADIPQYAPHVSLDGVQLATFCKDDGLADPHEFLSGYEHACRRLGVEIMLETEVTGINVVSDKVTEVVTDKGTIACGNVVNATGAFAGKIGELVGAEVPVEPIRRQCVTTGQLDFIEPYFPMVVNVQSGLYCHKESKGLLLGWADKDVKPSFDISIDPDYTDNILERALELVPQLETAEVANQWAGLYETTPDHRAIIGWEPKVSGLFHAVGFSGHGMMHAPATGVITAEMLADKEPSIDITDLRPTRFAEGAVVEETNVI